MSYSLSGRRETFCLIFGVVEALGATLWCLAGAGIYGSPLHGMRGPELALVGAFLLTGPLSALLASIVVLWRPRWGAAWLIAGGLASGALAALYLSTDAHILPLAVVSLPMLVIGLWLIRASAGTLENGSGFGSPRGPREQLDSRGRMVPIMWGVLLFLVAVVGTYALIIVLSVNDVTGLRGAIRLDNPFVHENENVADGVVVMLVAIPVALITLVRKRLRLSGEAVAGMWIAVLLGGLIILIR